MHVYYNNAPNAHDERMKSGLSNVSVKWGCVELYRKKNAACEIEYVEESFVTITFLVMLPMHKYLQYCNNAPNAHDEKIKVSDWQM